MMLSYPLRVLGLCLAAGFVLHAALALGVRLLAPLLQRRAETLDPRAAARRVLAWRAAPLAAAAALTGGVLLPVYLHFEPVGRPEEVGMVFLLLAGLGAATALLALWRGGRGFLALHRLEQACRRGGQALAAEAAELPVSAVRCAEPFVVLAGARRPRIVVSTAALERLTPAQLAAALHHEQAHQAAGDRWRRALLLLLPDALPGWHWRTFDTLWTHYAEWAADRAAAAGGHGRALDLAEALLAVARGPARRPPLEELVPGLTGNAQELAERVNRLLTAPAPAPPVGGWGWTRPAVWALLTAAAVLLLPRAAALYPLLEHLVR